MTAISVEETLFEKVEALARELDISRSRLFALAAQEFIDRHQAQRLLEAINTTHDDLLDLQEQALRQQMRARQRELVAGQWQSRLSR